MAKYFFTDANGNRQGPYDEQQLQALVVQGMITPNTPMETESGHKGVAGQIPGLTFPTVSAPPFAQAPSYSHTGESKRSILFWPLDFSFQDIRIHIINLWACRIVYVICWLIAAFYLIVGTVSTFRIVDYMMHESGTLGILGFLLVPLLWIGIALGIVLTRLYLEFCLILLDWMVETTKAARLYLENNKKE